MAKKKGSAGNKVKNVILSIAIAIIFAFFVGRGIDVFYPSPEWDDYCDQERYMRFDYELNKDDCEGSGGNWSEYSEMKLVPEDRFVCRKMDQGVGDEIILSCEYAGEEENGYCDINYKCEKDFDEADEKYSKNVFIITLVIGILAIVLSVMLQLVSVSAGLMVGGLFLMIYGTMRYWEYSSDILRFVLLGVILAILIWLGYKKLNK